MKERNQEWSLALNFQQNANSAVIPILHCCSLQSTCQTSYFQRISRLDMFNEIYVLTLKWTDGILETRNQIFFFWSERMQRLVVITICSETVPLLIRSVEKQVSFKPLWIPNKVSGHKTHVLLAPFRNHSHFTFLNVYQLICLPVPWQFTLSCLPYRPTRNSELGKALLRYFPFNFYIVQFLKRFLYPHSPYTVRFQLSIVFAPYTHMEWGHCRSSQHTRHA